MTIAVGNLAIFCHVMCDEIDVDAGLFGGEISRPREPVIREEREEVHRAAHPVAVRGTSTGRNGVSRSAPVMYNQLGSSLAYRAIFSSIGVMMPRSAPSSRRNSSRTRGPRSWSFWQ